MDPFRLHLFLTAALTMAGLSPCLASQLFAQALRQYHARWPLVGCGIKYDTSTTTVITVGRN